VAGIGLLDIVLVFDGEEEILLLEPTAREEVVEERPEVDDLDAEEGKEDAMVEAVIEEDPVGFVDDTAVVDFTEMDDDFDVVGDDNLDADGCVDFVVVEDADVVGNEGEDLLEEVLTREVVVSAEQYDMTVAT